MLHEFTKTVLLIVAGLFPVINPPASGFIVLSMVPYATSHQRAKLAWRISVNGFIILLASLLIGAYVLSFFGISIPVLRVAGGLIVAVTGWNLLQSSSSEEKAGVPTPTEDFDSSSMAVKAFYPLTLPITVGPGSISVAIALG